MGTVFVIYRRMRIDWDSSGVFEVYGQKSAAQARVDELTRAAEAADKPEYDAYWMEEVPYLN